MPNPNGYPLDLTAVASSNLIVDEVHTLTNGPSRTFVPEAGPFYTDGLQLRHGVTNVLLQPMVDYVVLHLHRAATRQAFKEVCAVVLIKNANIPSVKMRYQCIGGPYSETADVIRTLLAQYPINDPTMVGWGDIIGIPNQFTPSEHLHHFDELYGANAIVAVLEQIRIAILAGDSGAFNAVYQYIYTVLQNIDYVTQDQLDELTDLIPFIPVKSVLTLDDLRALDTMANNAPSIYIACGRDDFLDGHGRIYIWDITCTLADDNNRVIRPTSIPALNAGRFILFEQHIKDVDDIRAVMAAHGIGVSLAANNHTNADLNTLTQTARWHVSDVSPNRPFNFGSLYVEQWVTTTGYSDIKQTMEGADGYFAVRYGYRFDDGDPFSWTNWVYRNSFGSTTQVFSAADGVDPFNVVNNAQLATAFAALWSRLTHAGIDASLALTNSVSGQDLDAVDEPGEYYYTTACAHRPSSYGLLKVWQETTTIVYQKAQTSDNQIFTRYRSGVGVWSAWKRYVTAEEISGFVPANGGFDTTYVGFGVGGGDREVWLTIADNIGCLGVTINAPGGGGGDGGYSAGGAGGGGGAGGFMNLRFSGRLGGLQLHIVIPPANAANAGGGYNSAGPGVHNNPSAYVELWDTGFLIFSAEIKAGQTADGGWGERPGSAVSYGGAAGAPGSASTTSYNACYGNRAVVCAAEIQTGFVAGTSGGDNVGAPGVGGTVNDGVGATAGSRNPNNYGYGGNGGPAWNPGDAGGVGAARVVY